MEKEKINIDEYMGSIQKERGEVLKKISESYITIHNDDCFSIKSIIELSEFLNITPPRTKLKRDFQKWWGTMLNFLTEEEVEETKYFISDEVFCNLAIDDSPKNHK